MTGGNSLGNHEDEDDPSLYCDDLLTCLHWVAFQSLAAKESYLKNQNQSSLKKSKESSLKNPELINLPALKAPLARGVGGFKIC